MKIWLTALVCAFSLAAQDGPAVDQKHLTVPVPGSAQPLSARASSIERETQHPAVIHLKGDVEIRIPICVVTGPGSVQHCAGETVIHAKEADLYEDTAKIQANGNVTIDRR